MMNRIYKTLGLCLGLSLSQIALAKTPIIKSIPKFSLPELGKPAHKISNANLPKTPYLLTTWASWCGACREENDYLKTLSRQGIKVVGLNTQDESADAKQFLKRHGNPFLFNIQDNDGILSSKLGIPVLPYTLLVDSHGIIRQRIEGQLDTETLNGQIQPCLSALNKNASISEIKKACQ